MIRFLDTIFVASMGFGLGMIFQPWLLNIVGVSGTDTLIAGTVIAGIGLVGMAGTR